MTDIGLLKAGSASVEPSKYNALVDEVRPIQQSPVFGEVPEVPATPDAQDVVDALLTLGLVTQAEA